MNSSPLFGTFTFGFDGRILYLYALGVLFLCWAYARTLVCTPFGRRMVGIRENRLRMSALGVNVKRTELVVFCISSAMAGVAGALSAQIDQFVSLNALGFELSSMVLVVLIFGGMGRLYGAFVGAPIFLLAQDYLSKDDPVHWHFWLGLMLMLIVLSHAAAFWDQSTNCAACSARGRRIQPPKEGARNDAISGDKRTFQAVRITRGDQGHQPASFPGRSPCLDWSQRCRENHIGQSLDGKGTADDGAHLPGR